MKNNYLILALISFTTTSSQMCNSEVIKPFEPITKPPTMQHTASNTGKIATEYKGSLQATLTKPTVTTLSHEPTPKETQVAISTDQKPITASELMKKIQDKQKANQTPEQKATAILINSKATAIDAINKAFEGNKIQLSANTKVALSRAIDAKNWEAFNNEIDRMLTVASRKGPNIIDKNAINNAIIAAEKANVGTRLQNALKLTLAHTTVSFRELLQPFKDVLENQRLQKALQGKTIDLSKTPQDSSGFFDITLQPNISGTPEEAHANLANFLDQGHQAFLAEGEKIRKAQAEIDAQEREKLQNEYDQNERELQDIWEKQAAEKAKANQDQLKFLQIDSKSKKSFPRESISQRGQSQTPKTPIKDSSIFLSPETAPTQPQEATTRPQIEINTDSSQSFIPDSQLSSPNESETVSFNSQSGPIIRKKAKDTSQLKDSQAAPDALTSNPTSSTESSIPTPTGKPVYWHEIYSKELSPKLYAEQQAKIKSGELVPTGPGFLSTDFEPIQKAPQENTTSQEKQISEPAKLETPVVTPIESVSAKPTRRVPKKYEALENIVDYLQTTLGVNAIADTHTAADAKTTISLLEAKLSPLEKPEAIKTATKLLSAKTDADLRIKMQQIDELPKKYPAQDLDPAFLTQKVRIQNLLDSMSTRSSKSWKITSENYVSIVSSLQKLSHAIRKKLD